MWFITAPRVKGFSSPLYWIPSCTYTPQGKTSSPVSVKREKLLTLLGEALRVWSGSVHSISALKAMVLLGDKIVGVSIISSSVQDIIRKANAAKDTIYK